MNSGIISKSALDILERLVETRKITNTYTAWPRNLTYCKFRIAPWVLSN